MADPNARLPSLTPPARRLNLGAPSARSLLLTVLGEWVLPGGGEAWTSALLAGLGAVGVEAVAARQAVARSAAAGLLASEKVGRRTRWALTEEARRLLDEGTRRIYGFATAEPEWDGRWVLLLTSVPEASRHLRYRLRTRLGWAGFGALSPGCWISPWVDRQAAAAAVVADLGLAGAAVSFVATLGSLGDARQMAAQAWDLKAVDADYQGFIAVHGRQQPATDEAAFGALTLMVDEWRHFPSRDPVLPTGLLPAGWKGREAARLFHALHRDWAAPASRWWAGHNR
ncbi:MAG TPA: PaaX family transcriptional regulator C-terminal domain-containing protein [Acidimicrobiales bacterium]|nr:PaaX family transcriptional regulator C-terminal domain-containing protein [Acidimicrobiales bacterium]